MRLSKTTMMAALLLSVAGGAAMARGMGDMAGMEGGMGGMEMMMPGGPGADGLEPGFDFAAVDADKDGKVTQAELQAFRAARVATVDADKDGKLSEDEVKAMVLARMTARAEDMASAMIERMDSDGDGFLTAAELAAPPAPTRLFDRIDADGDGAITEDEIAAAREAMAEMRGGRGEGPRGGHHGHGRGWFFFGGDN